MAQKLKNVESARRMVDGAQLPVTCALVAERLALLGCAALRCAELVNTSVSKIQAEAKQEADRRRAAREQAAREAEAKRLAEEELARRTRVRARVVGMLRADDVCVSQKVQLYIHTNIVPESPVRCCVAQSFVRAA